MSEKSLNVLVTGASGLLGRQVYQFLTDEHLQHKYPISIESEFSWNCLGLCYSRKKWFKIN